MATSGRWRSAPADGATAWRAAEAPESERAAVVRLLDRLSEREGKTLQWRSLARLAPAGMDRLDVERLVEGLVARGWVQVKERRDPRGNVEPYLVRATPGMVSDLRGRVERLLGPPGSPSASRADRLIAALQTLMAREDALPVPARALVQLAFGDTKAVRVRDFRADIEHAFETPLEDLVRDHAAAVLTAGPLSYTFRGRPVDARASFPWLAIPEPVLAELDDLRIDAAEVVTVENLTAFEALVHDGLAERAVVVFTSGFLGRAQRRWMTHLVRHPAIRAVRHWGDLDPGGLLIYRTLQRLISRLVPAVPLRPWRMDPALLDHPLAVPLTPHDRHRLFAYLTDSGAPLRALARAMVESDHKLEQEALLLDGLPADL